MYKFNNIIMKKIVIVLMLAFFGILIGPNVYGMKVTIPGKGGVVVDPNGSRHICPQFAFRKCATIEISWGSIWDYIWDSVGSQDIWELNDHMPISGIETLFDDDGSVISVTNVTVTWIDFTGINANSQTTEIQLGSGSDITLE
jgi:hypothetical protein